MNATIDIELTPRPHPFPNEPGSATEGWGELLLSATTGGASETILRWQWDLGLFVEWYLDCRESLWTERLPDVRDGESLAEAIHRLQDRDFPDEEEDAQDAWLDMLYQFRQHHSLRFALRGADIPEIILGLNRNAGELSSSSEKKTFRYSFDIAEFQQKAERQVSKFLADWVERTTPLGGSERARSLKEQWDGA